jgi:ribose transport system substrate-binding protein
MAGWLTISLVTVLAACGTSDGGTTSAGDTPSVDLEKARAEVVELRADPVPIELPALGKRPAAGKKAIWLGCKYPECAAVTSGLEPATEALGWQLETVRPDLTPEAISAAWTQAVAARPDVIFAIDVVPVEAIATQLDDAERAGIQVLLTAGPTATGEHGVDAAVGSVPFRKANSTAMTQYAIADSGGRANILLVYDPSIPLQLSVLEAAKSAAAACSGCEFGELPVQLAQAGKTVPGQVISYLQRNPDVTYVITTGSGALGVGQALKSAGLSQVKLVTSNAQPQDLLEVQKGLQAAAIPNEEISIGWRLVDAAARLQSGEKLLPELADPVGQRQLFDKTNIGRIDVGKQWNVPDNERTFRTAWGIE